MHSMKRLLYTLGLDSLLPHSLHNVFTTGPSSPNSRQSSRPGTPNSTSSNKLRRSRSKSQSRSVAIPADSSTSAFAQSESASKRGMKDRGKGSAKAGNDVGELGLGKGASAKEGEDTRGQYDSIHGEEEPSTPDWEYPLSPFTQQQSSTRPLPFRQHSSSSIITIKTPTPGSPRGRRNISTTTAIHRGVEGTQKLALGVPEITISPAAGWQPPCEEDIIRYRVQSIVALSWFQWEYRLLLKLARSGVTCVGIQAEWNTIIVDHHEAAGKGNVEAQEKIGRFLEMAEKLGLAVLLAVECPSKFPLNALEQAQVTVWWKDLVMRGGARMLAGITLPSVPLYAYMVPGFDTVASLYTTLLSRFGEVEKASGIAIPVYISVPMTQVAFAEQWTSYVVRGREIRRKAFGVDNGLGEEGKLIAELVLTLGVHQDGEKVPEEYVATVESKKVDYITFLGLVKWQEVTKGIGKVGRLWSMPFSGESDAPGYPPQSAPSSSSKPSSVASVKSPPPSRALALSKKSALKRAAVDTYTGALSGLVPTAPITLTDQRPRTPTRPRTPVYDNSSRSQNLTRTNSPNSQGKQFTHSRHSSEAAGGTAGYSGLNIEQKTALRGFEEGWEVGYMDGVEFMFPQTSVGSILGGTEKLGLLAKSSVQQQEKKEEWVDIDGSSDGSDVEVVRVPLGGRIGLVEIWIERRLRTAIASNGGLLPAGFEEGLRIGLEAFYKVVQGK